MKTVKKINLEMNEAEAELMIQTLDLKIEILIRFGATSEKQKELLRRLTILKSRILSEME